jgi:hypothetical protein
VVAIGERGRQSCGRFRNSGRRRNADCVEAFGAGERLDQAAKRFRRQKSRLA